MCLTKVWQQKHVNILMYIMWGNVPLLLIVGKQHGQLDFDGAYQSKMDWID